MKKNELKKMLKPLIKECIRESLFEEGMLSGLVSEVVRGMGTAPIVESRPAPAAAPAPTAATQQIDEARAQRMKQQRKQLLDSIGRDAFNGVDVFEGVTPAAAEPSRTAAHSPLGDQDPNDPGIDISNLFAGNGRVWQELMKK